MAMAFIFNVREGGKGWGDEQITVSTCKLAV